MLETFDERHDTGKALRKSYDGAYGEKLSNLESAILATVTYRDLFDFPVARREIHRYLQGVACRYEDVVAALENEAFATRYFDFDGDYVALKGRTHLFALRQQRQRHATALWGRATRYGGWLASLPFVRMIAVTGSLAVENPGDHADIDFMLITDGGRMWSVRLMARVIQALNDKLGAGEVCVNHLVTTRALALDDPGLYVAQEVAQMVPIYGRDTYDRLRASNPWVGDYLPNADGAATVGHRCDARFPRIRRMLEFMLRSPFGRMLESVECRRKLRKYNETSFLLGRSTPFRAEATGHRRTARQSIETAFADRLKRPHKVPGRLRILFGQAYHLTRDPKLYRAMQAFPPLGTLYAAGVARSLGHDVRVHDSMLAHSVSEWAASLQVNDPDVAVLYEDNFNYLTKMCLLTMRDAALQMIRAAKTRGAIVVVCSADSSDHPEVYLAAGADYVLLGEGENTLVKLLPVLCESDAEPSEEIAGLAYLDAQGALVQTPKRPVIRHLDDIPMPAWDLLDLRRYREIWQRRHGHAALNMVTSRGCPYHCNWCAKPIWGQRYNARSPEHVVAELAQLRQMTEVDYLWFMDDIFGLKPGWILRFAEALEAESIEVAFKCLSRPDVLLRPGETQALARAGCDIVWLGAESGSQKILDAMEKGTTVDMIEAACALLRENGIRVGLFIQFGYPGETKQDIRQTVAMIRRIMPDELGISVSYPLPGTRFHERVRKELGRQQNWRDSDDLAMLFKGPYTTSYYRALYRYVHADLALRRTHDKPGSARKLAALGYYTARRTLMAAAMAGLSRLPHHGLRPMHAEMSPDAAATPTRQPDD